MTATAPRPRTGFLHRIHCARNGHYWERQLAGNREGALWVCVRCGKHGDGVRLVAARPFAHRPTPAEEWSADPEDWSTSWTAEMTDDDEVDDIVHAADGPPQHAAGSGAEPGPEPSALGERLQPSISPATVAVAVVSLAIVGGAAYLAFRRRRHR
jgi:hypothetical protein